MAKEIKGAQLLTVGTWNNATFTESDLQSMVKAFDLLDHKGRIPLKFGHDADHQTDGQPAYGWVDRLWVEGERLMADIAGIPDKVYELVRDGMYKFVSIEALRNVKASTGVIPWVLDAVALLGADKPAVGVLRDIQGLALKRKSALLTGARVSFSQGVRFKLEDEDMTPEEVQAMVDKTVTPIKAELAETKVALTAAKDEAKAAKDQLHTFSVKNKRDGIKAKFEAAVKADELAPAKRDQFYKFARVDDDAGVQLISDEDVTAYLKDNYQKPKAKAPQGGDGNGDQEPEEVQARIQFRADKRAVELGVKPHDIVGRTRIIGEVLRADAKLAAEYRNAVSTGLTATA